MLALSSTLGAYLFLLGSALDLLLIQEVREDLIQIVNLLLRIPTLGVHLWLVIILHKTLLERSTRFLSIRLPSTLLSLV